jgi:1-deoxy-D-xylulose-5-phosphate synthase
LKRIFMAGGLFEDLGIRYFGPVDGHNLEDLIEILTAVKDLPGPNLIHVVTTKGYGWELSEQDAIKWHASNPFDIESGKLKAAPAATPGLTKVFGEAITELAQKDKRIIGITGAMPEGCGLNIMAKALPTRVYDVGIAEEYAVTFAAGAACDGLKPVVAIYSTFLQRAFDQIVHDVAIQHLNVTFVLDRAGLVGLDGPTHHGAMDLSYLCMIPGMVILAPSRRSFATCCTRRSPTTTVPSPCATRAATPPHPTNICPSKPCPSVFRGWSKRVTTY